MKRFTYFLMMVLLSSGLWFVSYGSSSASQNIPTESIVPQIEQLAGENTYTVQPGDTPSQIAQRFNVNVNDLMNMNNITDPRRLEVGSVLIIPGTNSNNNYNNNNNSSSSNSYQRGSAFNRLTYAGRNAPYGSPYRWSTWVTFYGRPNVKTMGILGEYSIDELVPRLRRQANVYDRANGPELGVTPTFHLVYGMATQEPGANGDYLYFLSDDVVKQYIERAQQEGFAVILDIQIGTLSPVEALRRGLPWLKYYNVNLALDPEFAVTYPGQTRPGTAIGFVTAQQVNEAQWAMRNYMNANNLPGGRVLLVHQFLESMIQDKENLAWVNKVALTTTADGWGPPRGKISKYNSFVRPNTQFTGFKLFYRWDVPLMTEREALGLDRPNNANFVDTTPNLIIYQ